MRMRCSCCSAATLPIAISAVLEASATHLMRHWKQQFAIACMATSGKECRSAYMIYSFRSLQNGILIAPGSRKSPMRRIVTRLNEKRVHAWIVYDLFNLRLSACRTISTQRHTRPLAEVWQDVANEKTQTMATEHASER